MGILPAFGLWDWALRLGGVGLILLGLADHSLVPLPGSMDVLTIILAAHNKEWWWLYAICATVGAVLGGYLTFRLGQGGEKALEKKKIPKDKLRRAQSLFQKWGFGSLMIPALLPPPVPIVPFLITAGAMQYPTRKFVLALGSGRALRYFIVAWLGHIYGDQIIGFFSQYEKPILIALISLAVAGGITGLVLYLRRRKKKPRQVTEKAA